MKLIRLKITDSKGFRSLQSGFEHYFRKEWQIKEKPELAEFAPFVCAGPNGSGKSNLLEVLGAIFYQLEVLRIRRNFLPEILQDNDQDDTLSSFELDYLIKIPKDYIKPGGTEWANVSVWKESGTTVRFLWNNQSEFETNKNEVFSGGYADILLPQYIIGYSSGENEILSLPFFKMRFVQYDEYYHALKEQLPYGGSPESRLIYLDNSFSQAILLSNLLYQTDETLAPFREDVGIESLNEFRIIIKRQFTVSADMANEFGSNNPSIKFDSENNRYQVDLVSLLEANEALQKEISEDSEKEGSSSISAYGNFSPAITRLKVVPLAGLKTIQLIRYI